MTNQRNQFYFFRQVLVEYVSNTSSMTVPQQQVAFSLANRILSTSLLPYNKYGTTDVRFYILYNSVRQTELRTAVNINGNSFGESGSIFIISSVVFFFFFIQIVCFVIFVKLYHLEYVFVGNQQLLVILYKNI